MGGTLARWLGDRSGRGESRGGPGRVLLQEEEEEDAQRCVHAALPCTLVSDCTAVAALQ